MKTNKETRRVNTRMYGNLAFMILDRMHGDLGKYLWYVDVRRDVDDMVYFEVSTRKVSYPSRDCPQNPFLEKDDAHVLSCPFSAALGGRMTFNRSVVVIQTVYHEH